MSAAMQAASLLCARPVEAGPCTLFAPMPENGDHAIHDKPSTID